MTREKPVLRGYDRELFDICLGVHAPSQKVKQIAERLTSDCLRNLEKLVKLEFAVSFQQQLAEKESEARSKDAYPFDVCLVRHGSPGKNSIMVLVLKNKKFFWYDSRELWPKEGQQAPLVIKKLTSLSGTNRILQSICRSPLKKDSLMYQAMRREMLVNAVDERLTKAIAKSLNESQRKAVSTVSSPSFRRGFFAILGPPGCGKTTTMVRMILAMGKGVIVAAPSNAAVANIALKLHEAGRLEFEAMCVFGSNCHESVHFLSPTHRRSKYNTLRRRYDKLKDPTKRKKLCRELMTWLHLSESTPDITMDTLSTLCPSADRNTRWGEEKLKKILGKAQILFSTLNTLGSLFLRGAVNKEQFHTLMLDEGGQCNEAEFYIATTFPDVQKIVVVGDPKQLPATVISPVCNRAGYGQSWLARVHTLYPEKVHLLNTQYRMHPQILSFPNRMFYGDRIQCGANVVTRKPNINSPPFQFIDMNGQGEEKKASFSWKNIHEANVIKQVLQDDPGITALRGVKDVRIIVIAPYKAQVNVLQKLLPSVEVSTVDSYQGQEGDVVIISTVRTKKAGFVDDAQRLNVALTRAKRILRVVGDLDFFLSLGKKSTLRALALYAKNNGLVVSPFDKAKMPSKGRGTLVSRSSTVSTVATVGDWET
jgi:energy-coupling factor transporter ATP-binding protein EcfA2